MAVPLEIGALSSHSPGFNWNLSTNLSLLGPVSPENAQITPS